jgi:hypothetical protein
MKFGGSYERHPMVGKAIAWAEAECFNDMAYGLLKLTEVNFGETKKSRRHRDDRAASFQPKQAAHARSTTAKPLHATLARRALLRLDPMAAPHTRPLEYHTQNFLGFVQLACLIVLFRRF